MLGPFVDDAVFRISCADRSRDALLPRAKAALLDVLDHAAWPYEAINKARQIERPTPNGELFTILFNHLPVAAPAADEAAHARVLFLPRELASKYHVNVRLREGASWRLDVKFRADLYSDDYVGALLHRIVSTALTLADAHDHASSIAR
jgi:hypothetical protein